MTDGVLLRYQTELLETIARSQVTVVEKSRRIGATWAVAADAVLCAGAAREAHGSDVFYIGYNLEMAREFVDTCAEWARNFGRAAAAVEETLIKELGPDGESREIKAFRISFASGFEILALSSRPRSLRGRQGYVVIDEAAFHDDLDELLKAAMALLIWGGRVVVISTHDGVENPFNELVTSIRAEKLKYGLVRTTFDDAIADGLYRRVCLRRGLEWSAEAEVAWAAQIRADYGDAAAEELDCIPRRSGGKYLARTLLEARATAVPVFRWACDSSFVDLPDEARAAACAEWLEPVLAHIRAMPVEGRCYLGEDFGRSGDLSVQWPVVVGADLRRTTPFTIELRNVPFRQQEQILFAVCDALPRFAGAALDARGNGQFLAEFARQRYGASRVAEVALSERWYLEHMPPMKAALEDATFTVPADDETIDDLRSLEVVNGVARVNGKTKSRYGGERHGDGAVAACLALFASRTLEEDEAWSLGATHASDDQSARSAFAEHSEAGSIGRTTMVGWT